GFFNDVYDFANIMKPIRDAILIAGCCFSLACLGQSINKIPDENENASWSPPIDNDCEQVPSQDLEIINVLDLDSMDSMFKDKSNNITDKQLELMNLKEDDFDPDLLVQKFNYN
ncbi:365_t:CDS:2, partial [Rhizophagus irregularis]